MSHTPIPSSERGTIRTILFTRSSDLSGAHKATRILSRFAWIWFLLLWCAHTPLQGQPVLINEIMCHPPSTNLLEEWFELYNAGSNAVDLSGWQITKGVQFSFPSNTVIGAGGYLVVAADGATFTNNHPAITNFVAGWGGDLGHSLELSDNTGQVINSIQFYNDGDWAALVMGAMMYGHQGWESLAAHDGLGSSLELINPALPNTYAHNWASSTITNGTPGTANSIAQTNVAPFIAEVTHTPVIPRPSDVVTVSARIVDERTNGLTITLRYRSANTANPPPFTSTTMFDDGAHGDGVAADGIYGAILPAQPNATIIEFYVQAADLEGNVRAYPNFVPPTNSLRTANLLYQVDSGAYGGDQPVYRIIMTELERLEIYQLGRKCPDSDSDAAMNATWITQDGVVTDGTATQIRYNVGVRNRGHGTRQSNPNNYHVNIPSDRQWKKQSGINLNSQYAYNQVLGSALFRRLELPMADSRAVQVRVNSTNLMSLPLPDIDSYGSYAANEQYNNDFVKRSFPLDPSGNSYRGIRNSVLCDSSLNGVADLSWHGSNYTDSAYALAYFKQNNLVRNDWSDLIALIGVLNVIPGYSSPATYAADVQRVLNVDAWMKYMAVNTLMDNQETCLANGIGDDYALYRGANDSRFLALSYDMDSIMGTGQPPTSFRTNDSLFLMNALPVMDRFMKTPEFAPIYYHYLKSLATTTFSPAQMNVLLNQLLDTYIPQAALDGIKSFNAGRASYVLSQIPLVLNVSNSLPVLNGYPRATAPTTALFGMGNVIDTRTILVQGATSSWTAWQGAWTNNNVALVPGINRILVQALGTNGTEIARTTIDIWYDTGAVPAASEFGGALAADKVLTLAGSPYQVTNNLIIPAGRTLTVQPGVTVYLSAGVTVTVNDGGRILAAGADTQNIRLASVPGGGAWGGITINGSVGSVETRLAYIFIQGNSNTAIEVAGGALYLDHAVFGTTTHQYVSLDSSSFLISSCYFPTTTAPFELLHGNGGIKAGGRGIVRECFFGSTSDYNDIMDFTGGNRDENQPIIQYYNNVFVGGSDDQLDLDGTDAWIEGNIFLHCHRNGTTPDSSSSISGGNFNFGGAEGVRTSEITIIGNLFFDCDNAATAKEGNFFTFLNNTIVHQNHSGGIDSTGGVVNVRDFPSGGSPTAFGRGYYLEGNIIFDAEQLVRNYDSNNVTVTFNNNILPLAWNGPGTNNTIVDPRLNYIPQVSETYFTTWQAAQVMRDWFSLRPGSPALGAGPNGRDKGGMVPDGVSVSGEPSGTTRQTDATLTVGTLLSGFGIPTNGFPNGSGFPNYKWKLDNGAFSAEAPAATPILLSGLVNGAHNVTVVGRNDAGYDQNDPAFGPEATLTISKAWTVNPAYSRLLINEVLAKNNTTFTNGAGTPDMVELYNDSATSLDLSGMGLSSSSNNPYAFTFPPSTVLGAGGFLVVYADSDLAAPGIHLGFALKQSGDDLYLYASANAGGALLDSVSFGLQLPDLSIGRLPEGNWALCKPTFGSANLAQLVGDPRTLKINEWLADAQFAANNDFIELYNPDPLPVPLGGLYLSDVAGAPSRNPVPPLSFIAGKGFTSFTADGNTSQGADHVNFKLSPDVGMIILSAPDLSTIDIVNYGPQHTDISQGRSPNGGITFVSLPLPTPGGPNPGPGGGPTSVTNVSSLSITLLTVTNSPWRWDNSGTDRTTLWLQPGFDDSSWSNGFGLFGFETTPVEYPYPFQTYIPAPDQANGHITVYYRTHFQWTNSLSNITLLAANYLDDGAVFYLNGSEVNRLRVAGTPVLYSTLAANQPNEGKPEILTFPTGSLQAGDNVIEVEVHQVSCCGAGSSSDDVFGMSLSAVQYTTNIIYTAPTGVQVVLNEVLANNQSLTNANGSLSDWVELYNPGTNAVDLADSSLSDDPNAPRKWVFSANTTIAAGAYLVIYCDDHLPAAPNNTGFALNSSGETLFFFDRPAAGGGLLDAVVFGLQAPDFSIGRIPNGSGNWVLTVPSRGAMNGAAGLGPISGLKVNEWMANPASGSDWFEIYNNGNAPVPLGGLFLTDNLTDRTQSPVQPLSFISSNGFVQFFADGNSGADHVSFNLKKSGEAVGLFSPIGALVDGVTFGPQLTGVSQGRLPDGGANILSFATTPSPAESNYLPLTNAVVNEVLTHAEPPLENAIELFNPTGASVNIGGWFLSDTGNSLRKYRIPDSTLLPAGGFNVFYGFQFNDSNSPTAFAFSSANGGEVNLSAADAFGNLTGYRAKVKFGAAEDGVSFGQYQTSVGFDFTALSARTFGADNPASLDEFRAGAGLPNAAPKIGPVVINEIMYHPNSGGTENPDEEFLELRNVTASPVPLYDPNFPTNTWNLAGAVTFSFPTNTTLAAGGYALVVDFNPGLSPFEVVAFRDKYGVAASVPLFGPWNGRLNNKGDSVQLNKPDAVLLPPHPDAGFVPYILVDRVDYKPVAPWPASANGMSNSLQRIDPAAYGNDPVNWLAAPPTAGRATGAGILDTDGDGMDDNWEMAYFGTLARNGSGDFDGDNMTDLEEYLAGTNPTDPASNLRLIPVSYNGTSFVLSFSAVAGKSYRVQYSSSFLPGDWLTLIDIPPQSVTGPVQVTHLDALGSSSRFYRIITPAGP